MSGWTTMLFAQAINVSGTVVDAETDEPLIGATVRLKGVASKGLRGKKRCVSKFGRSENI